MFKHLLKTSIRNVIKNSTPYFISVLGLAIAAGICFVVVLFLQFQYGIDKGHKNYQNIYLVKSLIGSSDDTKTWGISPAPLKDEIEQYNEVELAVRLHQSLASLKLDDEFLSERVVFSDSTILKLFTFDFIRVEEFNTQNIIISEEISNKLFGSSNSVGEQMEVRINNISTNFIISGVYKDFSSNFSIRPKVILNIQSLKHFNFSIIENWGAFVTSTFVRLKSTTLINDIQEKFGQYLKKQNIANEEWPVRRFELEPLSTLSLNSYLIRGTISEGYGSKSGRIAMIMFSTLILLLASLNYANIALYVGFSRFKEVGIRKTFGGSREVIFLQFAVETFIVALIACILGFLFALSLLIPEFETLFNVQINDQYSTNYINYLIILITFSLVIGLLIGLFPSIRLSSLSVVKILNGGYTKIGKSNLKQILLLFQFIIAFVLIYVSVCLVQNYKHISSLSWGYNSENIIGLNLGDNASNVDFFEHEVSLNSKVVKTALTNHHVGVSRRTETINFNDKKYNNVDYFEIGKDYFSLMGLRIIEGNYSLAANSVVINEVLYNQLNRPDMGVVLTIDSINCIISGVVGNFRHANFNQEINSSVLKYNNSANGYLIIKSLQIDKSFLEFLHNIWKEANISEEFRPIIQDQIFLSYFQFINGHKKVMNFLAIISLVLALAGLYGMVALNMVARIKEMSIRKVLGSNKIGLFHSFSRPYNRILIATAGFGSVSGLYLISFLFENFYPNHIELDLIYLIITMAMVSVGVYIPVLWHYRIIINLNPSVALRN